MIDWLYLLMGIGLSIIGYIFTMLFGMIATDKKSSGLILIVIFVCGMTIMLIGVYSTMVGLGLFDLL